jgi:hypothetical protein
LAALVAAPSRHVECIECQLTRGVPFRELIADVQYSSSTLGVTVFHDRRKIVVVDENRRSLECCGCRVESAAPWLWGVPRPRRADNRNSPVSWKDQMLCAE